MADQNFRVKRGLEVGFGGTVLEADPSGIVGIATTVIGARLHVVPSTTGIAGLFSGTTSDDIVRITQLGSGNAFVVEDAANPDASRFVVTNAGLVGVGTTNPGTSNLAVVNTSGTAAFTVGQNVDGSGSNHLGIYYGGLVGSNANIFTSNGNLRFDVEGAGGPATAQIEFGRAFGPGFGGATWVVIDSAGEVGIGSTIPQTPLDVVGNIKLTGELRGPANFIIDPAAVGDNTGAVRIKGDLYVDGTQFVVNSTTIELADFNVGIATTVGTDALLDGAGIGIGSTSIRKTITWNNTAGSLTSSEDWNLVSGKQYEINGTSVLTSTTLGSGVVNSSLTSVGTLGQLNVSGITTTTTLAVSGVTTTRHLLATGVSTFSSATTVRSIRLGTSGAGIIDTSNGTLTLDADSGGASANGLVSVDGSGAATCDFEVTGASTLASLTVSGTTTLEGDVNIGNTSGDIIDVNGEFSTTSDLIPTTTNTIDLGSSTKRWRDLFLSRNATIAGSTNVAGLTTTKNLIVTGVSTIGTLGITDVTTTQHLLVTGVSTFSGLTVSGTGVTATTLNVTGVSTVTDLSGSNINFTGIITATGGFNIGIQSAGLNITTGVVTALNFIGAGNALAYNPSTKTVDVSIAGSGGGGSLSISTISSSQTHYITFVSDAGAVALGITQSLLSFVPSTGNLGLAVTSPSFKNDINGDMRVQGTNKVRFGGTTSSTNFYIQYNSSTNSLDFVAG